MSTKILDDLKEIKNEIMQIEQGLSGFDMLRERLKKEFGLDGLKDKLLSIPEEIEKKQKEAQEIKNQIPTLETEIKQIEADFTFQISAEMNGGEKPKPKFSNAETRRAELTKKLKVNKRYVELKFQKNELESEFFNYDIEIDKLRNTFRANLAIKDLIVAEINLYRS